MDLPVMQNMVADYTIPLTTVDVTKDLADFFDDLDKCYDTLAAGLLLKRPLIDLIVWRFKKDAAFILVTLQNLIKEEKVPLVQKETKYCGFDDEYNYYDKHTIRLEPNPGYKRIKTLYKIAMIAGAPELLVGPLPYRKHNELLFTSGQVTHEENIFDYDEYGPALTQSITVPDFKDFAAFCAFDCQGTEREDEATLRNLLRLQQRVVASFSWTVLLKWIVCNFIPHSHLRYRKNIKTLCLSGNSWKKIAACHPQILIIMLQCLAYTDIRHIHRALAAGYKNFPADVTLDLMDIVMADFKNRNPVPRRAMKVCLRALDYVKGACRGSFKTKLVGEKLVLFCCYTENVEEEDQSLFKDPIYFELLAQSLEEVPSYMTSWFQKNEINRLLRKGVIDFWQRLGEKKNVLFLNMVQKANSIQR